MAKDFLAIYCLYMPIMPNMPNISMLCLGKTKLCVCVCVHMGVCPPCAREHGDTNLGYLSGTLRCRYDYTQISTMPTEDTKQYSLRFTPLSRRLPPRLLLTENGELVAL